MKKTLSNVVLIHPTVTRHIKTTKPRSCVTVASVRRKKQQERAQQARLYRKTLGTGQSIVSSTASSSACTLTEPALAPLHHPAGVRRQLELTSPSWQDALRATRIGTSREQAAQWVSEGELE